MQGAARITDPIEHTSALSGLLTGLLIGAAIAVAAIAIVGTGGLAAVAIVGAGAAMGAGVGELVGSMSFAKSVSGAILQSGSNNTNINSLKAARAHVDVVECSKHPNPPKPIATGSSNVFINSMPAARVGDKTGCDAEISSGSHNVYIGGGTVKTDEISPEVPVWLHVAVAAVGIASAVILAGPVVAAFGLIGSVAGGYGGNWLGGKWFGEGSDGQKLMTFGGAFVGGLAGGKGGGWLSEKFAPAPEILPNDFASVYEKAPAAKAEIDAMADNIAAKYDGTVAKAPIKSEARALEKINNDYDGDATRIKDLARNTIIVDQDKVGSVGAELADRGATVKVIDADSNPMGYSGINSTIKTQAGIPGEIQVNSPEMIYAKEPEPLARNLLGDDVYDDISAKTGVPGGQGHALYEQYRVLDPKTPEANAIAEQSRAYYDAIRGTGNGH